MRTARKRIATVWLLKTLSEQMALSKVRNQWRKFSLKLAYDVSQRSILSKLSNFSFLNEAIHFYNTTQTSTFDPTKLASFSNLRPSLLPYWICRLMFEKAFPSTTRSFRKIKRTLWFMLILSVAKVSTLKLRKVGQFNNRKRKNVSRCCRKTRCIQNNYQGKCSSDKQNSSKMFLNQYNSWKMETAAVVSFKHNTDWDCLSNPYSEKKPVNSLEQT